MTCKDCIHYDVCVIVEHSDEDYDHYTEYGCEDFKNKADFVEVVRCKDCKKFMPYEGEEHKGDCEEFPELQCCFYEDDFCSYGERRDEE